jgi:hypothetical protein
VQLHHADVALCLVVIKWHGEIVHKGQHFPFVGHQAVEQVLGWALFDAPALFGLLGCDHRRRIGLQPLRNHPVVAQDKRGPLGLRQLAVDRSGRLDCRLDLHEQLRHLRRPALLIAFLDKRQFSQVMGITQTMGNVWVGEVRLPVVVHRPPCQRGQNPDGIDGF